MQQDLDVNVLIFIALGPTKKVVAGRDHALLMLRAVVTKTKAQMFPAHLTHCFLYHSHFKSTFVSFHQEVIAPWMVTKACTIAVEK